MSTWLFTLLGVFEPVFVIYVSYLLLLLLLLLLMIMMMTINLGVYPFRSRDTNLQMSPCSETWMSENASLRCKDLGQWKYTIIKMDIMILTSIRDFDGNNCKRVACTSKTIRDIYPELTSSLQKKNNTKKYINSSNLTPEVNSQVIVSAEIFSAQAKMLRAFSAHALIVTCLYTKL